MGDANAFARFERASNLLSLYVHVLSVGNRSTTGDANTNPRCECTVNNKAQTTLAEYSLIFTESVGHRS